MYHNVLEANEYTFSEHYLPESCSFAMDDGGRCLLDVISDPKLLQSFLESGSDENSKDPQDGTSSESAAESPQVSRSSHSTLANHLSSTEHLVEQPDQMGYSFTLDGQALLAQGGVCSTSGGVGGVSIVVATSGIGAQTYQHTSSSGATIHHLPSTVAHTNIHSPASARSVTPISHNIKSPSQGPSSVHSMPPPSPLQQIRSPLPSHTPSPAPPWSPAPPVLSPATSRAQPSMPSVAFQQSHNQILQTSCSVTQLVTALAATQQPIGQKLTLQQQQQLFLQQQLSPVSQPQSAPRLTTPVVTTAGVNVQPPMVQLIHAPTSNLAMPRTQHSTVRHIQPKPQQQILPKPPTSSANQFVSPAPAPKQAPPPPVTSTQRTMGVGIQPGATNQLVIGQGQPGVFTGPQGTFVLNQFIPGVGQSPILIQGNLGNLANIPGLQLTLRPPSNPPNQSLSSSNSQNNATLIAALQGPSQHTQTYLTQAKSPIHGQPTIVIPNNIPNAGLSSQNINLTSAGIPNSGIISSSSHNQGFLSRPNIILSPRVTNHGFQLQQIQTPNGTQFLAFTSNGQAIAVPHLPTALGNAQLAPVTLPMHGIGQGVISGLSLQPHAPPSALQQQQSLFGTAVPYTSHLEQSSQVIQVPQPLAPQPVPNHQSHIQSQSQIHQHQQVEHSPKPASPPKPSKVPSVNLEELLKEHGIVPENSPLPSPDRNSPIMEESVPQNIVSSQQLIAALQSQQVLLEQPQGHTSLPQIKLAFAPDGSVIFQSDTSLNNAPTRMQQFVSSGQLQSRAVSSVNSVILPTITTSAVSVPVITSESSSIRNHSTLIARLNAAPAISVPDVSSLAMSASVVQTTTSSITTTTITTTATTLVPSTVQSLSVNSSPISSSYVTQRTHALPASVERMFVTSKDLPTTHGTVTSVISTSSSSQNRINHATFQTLLVPTEHKVKTSTVHSMLKTSQPTNSASVTVTSTSASTQSVSAEQPRCALKEVQPVGSSDASSVVTNHNHSVLSPIVPNNLPQRLQKEISELASMKSRTPEQQKALQQLVTAQHKLRVALQNKSRKGCQTNQNQFLAKIESEIDRFLTKLHSVCSSSNNDSQIQLNSSKTQVLTQTAELSEKSTTNSKIITSHNAVHLVNLLKQNSNHTPVVKPIAPATTTITTACDSTTTTVAHSFTTTTNQKSNPVVTTAPSRIQISHHQNNKTSCEVVQQQVIVRLQKPTPQPQQQQQQQQPIQPCPNVQIKPPPPVKRVVLKPVLINEHLNKDQDGAVNPDVQTPFRSKADACRRLLKYHVYNSKVPSVAEINKADETFAMVSNQLMDRVKSLHNKFHSLLLKQSMQQFVPSDQVLIERLFLDDEKTSLEADKATVAEGKTLSLPPPPENWLPKLRACRTPSPQQIPVKMEVKEEPMDFDSCSRDLSDQHMPEDSSDPASEYKEDDNLEAPVIDSCEDIVVTPHDENLERSPPTLKRIVIKPHKCSESDSEEPAPSRKRLKFNNHAAYKLEPNSIERYHEIGKPIITNHSEKDSESKTNHKYSLLTREGIHSENRLDDMMSELRKEFDMSPTEMVVDGDSQVDFDPPAGAADFDPPVPRTEESCDSNILYNSSLRNNCTDKYDFDLLACSDWTEEYVHRQSNESDLAVESIVNHHHSNPSDLDLSGLDGLDDHLEDSQNSIQNGLQDDMSQESEMAYIGYRISKHNKRYSETSNCSNARDHQVQSAIKSIMGASSESRSYFNNVDADFLPLNSHGHTTHIASYSTDMNSHHRGEPDLEEAVRSILL